VFLINQLRKLDALFFAWLLIINCRLSILNYFFTKGGVVKMKGLVKFLITVLALVLTAQLLPGITIYSLSAGIWAALILGLANTFVRPVLTVFTFPLTVLTLGLFLFVINGLMFLLTANFVTGFEVTGIFAATIGSIVLSIINSLMSDIVEED
jgi:putative membrane protein